MAAEEEPKYTKEFLSLTAESSEEDSKRAYDSMANNWDEVSLYSVGRAHTQTEIEGWCDLKATSLLLYQICPECSPIMIDITKYHYCKKDLILYNIK